MRGTYRETPTIGGGSKKNGGGDRSDRGDRKTPEQTLPTQKEVSSLSGETQPERTRPTDFLAQNQVEPSQKKKATLGA